MSKFYIMRAYHLASTPRKISLRKIAAEHGDCTILVVDRETGWNKTTRTFILGAAGDYGVSVGDTVNYTVDTGIGHGRSGHMTIVDIIEAKDGNLLDENGTSAYAHPNAHTWVMK